MNQELVRRLVDLIGRVCLVAVFVIAVPVKITNFSSVVGAIVSRGIPESLSVLLLVAAIACLVVGPVLLLIGKKQKIGAALLLTFLVPTTIIFHLFPFQSQAVFMNLGLIGGLTLALTRPDLTEGD